MDLGDKRNTLRGRQGPGGNLSRASFMKALGLTPDQKTHRGSPDDLLIDLVIRETYRGPGKSIMQKFCSQSPEALRKSLTSAKRFILDDSMAAFLADLSTTPFQMASPLDGLVTAGDPRLQEEKVQRVIRKNMDTLTSIRHSAIPPFESTWVELPMRPFADRMVDLQKGKTGSNPKDLFGEEYDPEETIPRIGWLFQTNGDVVKLSVFGMSDTDSHQNVAFCLPFSFLYSITDFRMEEYPFGDARMRIDFKAATLGHGILMEDRSFGLVNHRPLDPGETIRLQFSPTDYFDAHILVPEFGGVLRRAMCFLAALGSIPKIEAPIVSPGGYLAGGQIRKHIPCTKLTLSLPGRRTAESVAKSLMEHVRHRWHQVRSHWRVRIKAGGRCCEELNHIWTAKNELGRSHCTQCDAVRTWIVLPNGRGDKNLGEVTHEYAVTRRTTNRGWSPSDE